MSESKTEKAEHYNVNVPDGYKLTFDKFGVLTNLDAPKMEFDKYRETHIEYTEKLGDATKSLTVETYLTANEFFKFAHELFGGGGE